MSKSSPDRNNRKFEYVVFDLYGTLFDLKSFASACDKLHRGKGEEILQSVRQKQLEYVLTRALVKKYRGYDSITKSAIKYSLQKFKLAVTEDRIEQLYSEFLRLEPFEDVESTLNDLDGIALKMMLLSNGTQEMVDKLVEHAGLSLLSEEAVSVEGSGAYKPDPKAYQHALNHMQVFEKQKILYVSGNTWDVAGARAFGFEVGWVNRTKQPTFDDEFRDLTPSYEFANLDEMKKMLLG